MRRPWERLEREELRALWGLWKDGQTFDAIGKAVGIPLESVYGIVARHGGLAPRERTRSPRTLSLSEREEISRGVARRDSVRAVARRLGRAPSTISREIRRHGGAAHYRATAADRRAWRRARRPKMRRLVADARLRQAMLAKLRADWSPEQIARWLRLTYPEDARMQISHETIYRTLYVQARGALKRELMGHLRRQRTMRRSGGAPAARARQSLVAAVD